MGKMKRFFLYFLMFLGLYIFITILTNFQMKEKFEEITDYEISMISPKINVDESRATYSHGYIKGNIINDTGNHIKDKYLQFDFYDKDGIYLGTESQEIKYFNVNEKVSFDIQYNYKNANKIKISFVDEVIEPASNGGINLFSFNGEQDKLVITMGIALALFAILP